MYRIKVLLVSLLAVFAVSSVVAASASAALEGPWYKQVKGKQIKLERNKEQPIKSENEGSFKLKGKLVGSAVVIECATAKSTGNIWNGLLQGEDNATVEFGTCTIGKAIVCVGAPVEVTPSKVFSELQWKYAGNTNELKEVGQQKIYNVFAPTAEPVAGKATFTKVNILKANCETINGEFPVEAAGTLATFVDQNGTSHKIVWGTAAVASPQNTDVVTNRLTWASPNVTELHHQGTQTKAKLLFGGAAAELEGTLRVELNSGEEFGVSNL